MARPVFGYDVGFVLMMNLNTNLPAVASPLQGLTELEEMQSEILKGVPDCNAFLAWKGCVLLSGVSLRPRKALMALWTCVPETPGSQNALCACRR